MLRREFRFNISPPSADPECQTYLVIRRGKDYRDTEQVILEVNGFESGQVRIPMSYVGNVIVALEELDTHKAYVAWKLDAMEARWDLYAVTKEGFLNTIWAMLELCGASDDALRFRLAVPCLPNNAGEEAEPMDEAFAKKSIPIAREILAELP